jgi:hypothetical protein
MASHTRNNHASNLHLLQISPDPDFPDAIRKQDGQEILLRKLQYGLPVRVLSLSSEEELVPERQEVLHSQQSLRKGNGEFRRPAHPYARASSRPADHYDQEKNQETREQE